MEWAGRPLQWFHSMPHSSHTCTHTFGHHTPIDSVAVSMETRKRIVHDWSKHSPSFMWMTDRLVQTLLPYLPSSCINRYPPMLPYPLCCHNIGPHKRCFGLVFSSPHLVFIIGVWVGPSNISRSWQKRHQSCSSTQQTWQHHWKHTRG